MKRKRKVIRTLDRKEQREVIDIGCMPIIYKRPSCDLFASINQANILLCNVEVNLITCPCRVRILFWWTIQWSPYVSSLILHTASVSCMTYSFLSLQITWADFRPQVKYVVNLVIADGHFNLAQGVCMGMHGWTYSFYSQVSRLKSTIALSCDLSLTCYVEYLWIP